MIFFIGFIVIMFLIVVIGVTIAINNFGKNVEILFKQSAEIKGKMVSIDKEALPEPVWRYFLHVMNNPQPYISYVRLKHHGQFKTAVNANWKEITGEEYFTIENPGFIWKGRVGFMTAIDSFVSGNGSLKVYLFSILRIANGSGTKFTQGELLRWLGESVWFPTALLPSDKLQWETIDDYHAKLVYAYNKIKVYYIVTFNEDYEITMLKTKRYMDGRKLRTWIGKLFNYELLNGVLVPTKMEAIWRLNGNDFSYAVFHLNLIEYNKPQIFNN
jgi:hypothetical protein